MLVLIRKSKNGVEPHSQRGHSPKESRGSDDGSDRLGSRRRNFCDDHHEMISETGWSNSGLGLSAGGEGGSKMAT
jgi:hypothetical protein